MGANRALEFNWRLPTNCICSSAVVTVGVVRSVSVALPVVFYSIIVVPVFVVAVLRELALLLVGMVLGIGMIGIGILDAALTG